MMDRCGAARVAHDRASGCVFPAFRMNALDMGCVRLSPIMGVRGARRAPPMESSWPSSAPQCRRRHHAHPPRSATLGVRLRGFTLPKVCLICASLSHWAKGRAVVDRKGAGENFLGGSNRLRRLFIHAACAWLNCTPMLTEVEALVSNSKRIRDEAERRERDQQEMNRVLQGQLEATRQQLTKMKARGLAPDAQSAES
jgi:hypothetical protein